MRRRSSHTEECLRIVCARAAAHTTKRVLPNGRLSSISRHALGHGRGRSTASSAALRVFVCAICAETFLTHRGTSEHRLRMRSRPYNIARVAERPSFSPISRHALGHLRGRSTASSAALRAFVCAKCVETFLTHKGTSAHRLCTRSRAYSMARVDDGRGLPFLSVCIGPSSEAVRRHHQLLCVRLCAQSV